MLFKVLKMLLAILILIVVVMMVMFVIKARASANGEPAGLQSGVLMSCPASPNCVSSEDGTPESHATNSLSFSGDAATAWQKAGAVVAKMGGKVSSDSGEYLAASYASSLFGFVDDLELRLDRDNAVIQIRSASREGYSDMGVNAKRVAAITAAFQQQ